MNRPSGKLTRTGISAHFRREALLMAWAYVGLAALAVVVGFLVTILR